jgi:hypothetical protein
MKQHFIRFGNEFRDAFIKALANTVSGAILIGLVFCLTQTEASRKFLNRITGAFEKYVQAQSEINKSILSHLKTHEESNDSLSSKNKNHDSKKERQITH